MINPNFKVTFAIREDIYFQFKDICLKEKTVFSFHYN